MSQRPALARWHARPTAPAGARPRGGGRGRGGRLRRPVDLRGGLGSSPACWPVAGRARRANAASPGLCRRPEAIRRGAGERPRLTTLDGTAVTAMAGVGGLAERVLMDARGVIAIPGRRAGRIGGAPRLCGGHRSRRGVPCRAGEARRHRRRDRVRRRWAQRDPGRPHRRCGQDRGHRRQPAQAAARG